MTISIFSRPSIVARTTRINGGASSNPGIVMAAAPPLSEALLKDKTGAEVKASTLWKDKAALVVVLRRPGCLLCREEAMHIWGQRAEYDALGIQLACVLHEWKEREVEAFSPEYWGGPLYLDESKAFYATVHGGAVRRGSIIDLLNPFSQAWKNVKRAKACGAGKDSNLVGDGLTMGGLVVLKKGGEIMYTYGEKTFGDHAPESEVMEACKKAAAGNQ